MAGSANYRKRSATASETATGPSINISEEKASAGNPKGGQVVLIFVTLMIGYLYITGRLQAVVAAILHPGTTLSGAGGGGGTGNPSPYPANPDPSLGKAQYPARFQLAFDPRYHAGPVQIEAADVVRCRQLVYNAALQVTGSMSQATTYANQFCP